MADDSGRLLRDATPGAHPPPLQLSRCNALLLTFFLPMFLLLFIIVFFLAAHVGGLIGTLPTVTRRSTRSKKWRILAVGEIPRTLPDVLWSRQEAPLVKQRKTVQR